MRELLMSLLLATCLLPIGACGLTVASGISEEAAPAPFANLHSEALWTSQVRRIDVSQQAYDRLPSNVAENTIVAEAKLAQRVNLTLMGSSRTNTSSNQNLASHVEDSQPHSNMAQEWCGSRYRSYDPSDNTYQPFGGGARRTCDAPIDAITASAEQPGSGGIVRPYNANATWCMERYDSYRVEDNTYQPYVGGRKQCVGPGTQSASNDAQGIVRNAVVQF